MSDFTRMALLAAAQWLRDDAERRAEIAARCCQQCVLGAAERNAVNIASAEEIESEGDER